MLTPLQTYFPIGVVLLVAVGQAFLLLGLANTLGPRRPSLVKTAPFECGSEPVGSARDRFGVKFYVVALLFIVFDIEAIFLYPWAVLFTELGWAGYVEMAGFIFTVVLGLVYVWKKGVIDWND
jgi:NADH-quinone oxidoreductase subunit A